MKGYIFQSAEGSYLGHHQWWFGWERIEQAYVHPFANLPLIVDQSRHWEVKPVRAYPAKYKDGEVTVLGEPIDFATLVAQVQS